MLAALVHFRDDPQVLIAEVEPALRFGDAPDADATRRHFAPLRVEIHFLAGLEVVSQGVLRFAGIGRKLAPLLVHLAAELEEHFHRGVGVVRDLDESGS